MSRKRQKVNAMSKVLHNIYGVSAVFQAVKALLAGGFAAKTLRIGHRLCNFCVIDYHKITHKGRQPQYSGEQIVKNRGFRVRFRRITAKNL